MKKRKILTLVLSLFSLTMIVSCTTKNDEPNNSNDDDFDIIDPAGDDSVTIVLNDYKGDNYTFDNTVSNESGSVSYEIFVRSFYDSDNDGIGDFNGIKSKLNYLKELGVKTLWLMPIMPSPTYHGYDVTDYYDVNSDYGTLDDFKELTKEAKKNNIDIMIDIVFNHSSTKHPWFKESYDDYIANNVSPSSKADWYCWNQGSKAGYSIYSGSNGIYYESRFDYSMPDFNTKNDAVRNEMVNILDFWVDNGVSGFRFDAVKYYDYNATSYNTSFLTYLNDEIKKEHEDVYFVGECWESDETILSYYNSTFESFFKFSSSLEGNGSSSILSTVKCLQSAQAFGNSIEVYEKKVKENNPNGYTSYFLANHDMDRSSNSFIGNYAKMAASITYLLPGTPFMYYGEEISLMGKRNTTPDDLSDAKRRLPMIWSSKVSTGLCGFPEASRQDLNKYEQVTVGVDDALEEGYSLVNHYKKVINIRNKYSFIKNSVFTNQTSLLNTTNTHVLAYKLSYNGELITIIQNLYMSSVEVDVSSLGTEILDEVSASKKTPEISNGHLKLGAYSTVILK